MCCRWGLGSRITCTDPWNVLANACDDTLRIESVAILPFPATWPTMGSPGARLSLCLFNRAAVGTFSLVTRAEVKTPHETLPWRHWASAVHRCGWWLLTLSNFFFCFFKYSKKLQPRPSLTAPWLTTSCQELQDDFPLITLLLMI